MFVGLHAALAAKTGIEKLAITSDEGELFMQRAADVMRHYSVQTTQKTMDWIAFIGAASGMYIPRVVAIVVERKGSDDSEPADGRNGDVIDLPQFIGPN